MNINNKILGEITGVFFNIQHFSVHDGPGIRTVFFAKGCPLRCQWCSNPESQKAEPEVAIKSGNCIGVSECGQCIDVCPAQIISSGENDTITIDFAHCSNCGECVKACPANALIFLGQDYTIDQLTREIEEDGNYFWRSGGGPTIGGGEPFFQPLFVSRLLECAKAKGYNTTVDTCGYFDLSDHSIDLALKNTDTLLYDIKLMDPISHKLYTGHTNESILSNIVEISKNYPKIEIVARTPVIPGINDNEKTIKEIAMFLRNIVTLKDYELLAYHGLGSPKYAQLGRQYGLDNQKQISSEKMQKLQDLARKILKLS